MSYTKEDRMNQIRITRLGCLAVHLMPEYHGRRLDNAVKRIAKSGPANAHEARAVAMANADVLCEGPLLPEARIK